MRKSVFVLAVIGAACSSVAFAAEVKKDKAHVPAVKVTTMSDAEMDKVTAGAASNIFVDSSLNITKVTGSVNVLTGFGNDQGALNVHVHIANGKGLGSP